MRVAIVGCGAMGSVYAGLFAAAGVEVFAVDPWAEHMAAIARNGLAVSGASGDRVVRLAATTDPAEVPPCDLAIIAAKASGVAQAAGWAARVLAPDGVALTIQNGLGSADIVAAELGADRLLVGIAGGFGASIPAPGRVHHNGMETVRLGPFAGCDPARAEAVAALWRRAGFRAAAVADIAAMQWEKLICNVAYSGPCGLTGLTIGAVMDDPELGPVSRDCATEAWRVARARGVRIAVEDPVAHVREFGSRIPAAKPSVLLDLEAGRVSEIGVINGAIPVQAARCGLTAPVNAAITALVRVRERGFSPRTV